MTTRTRGLTIYLALATGSKVERHGHMKGMEDPPSLLVSYYYLEPFLKGRPHYDHGEWIMDSGAFSAKAKGVEIDLQAYTDCCKKMAWEDESLREVFALDVIGDHVASRRNTEWMWEQDVPAIPTFHYGSPWAELLDLAACFPKIALGGAVGLPAQVKLDWVGQCFARVWPKRIHGFGMCGERMLMAYPFESVDASNWEVGPTCYGNWRAFGGYASRRGSDQNLVPEIRWYQRLERRARQRWRREMEKLYA